MSHRLILAVLVALVALAAPADAAPILQAIDSAAAQFVNYALIRSVALYFTCLGLFILVAAVFLGYWRWVETEIHMLAVGLLALAMAAHTAAVSGALPYLLSPLLDGQAPRTIETAAYLLLNAVIALILWAYFPASFRPRANDGMSTVNTVVAGAVAASSVVLTAASFLPGDPAPLLAASRWLTVLLMTVAAALAVQSVQTGKRHGTAAGIGLGLLIIGSFHDALFAGLGAAGRSYVITFAVLGFVLLQSYVVLWRSAEAMQMARLRSRRLRREIEKRSEKLRSLIVEAQAANRAKTEFVTAVTHELRSPLSSLLAYVDLIRDEIHGDLTGQQREFFDSLQLNAERLLNLVNNLLDLAKIEAGRVDVTLSKVDVAKIVEAVRTELYPLARGKHLYLNTDLAAEQTCVATDEVWLRVVLINLLSNAVKYTEEGGVTVRIRQAEIQGRTAASIEIVDTGPGISAEFMPRLFERFARENQTEADVQEGTGLGLTIARELTDLLGGEIRVDSTVGEGTTFAVVLPVTGPPTGS